MGENARKTPNATIEGAAWLFALTALLFAVSVYLRADGLGKLPVGVSSWTTTGSALCAKHWNREGAWPLRFTMYREPHSIETPNAARKPYLSFPPGAIAPLYLLGRIFAIDPNPTLTMSWNLFVQFFAALALAHIAYVTLLCIGAAPGASVTFSMIPPILYLFLRGPFYEHQMGYFSDQAVMLPFALFALFEIIRFRTNKTSLRFVLDLIQAAVIFCGMMTDWLFVFVLVCGLIFRAVTGQFGYRVRPICCRAVLYLLPAALALALFAVQLAYHDGFATLYERFVFGAGVEPNGNLANPGLVQHRISLLAFFTVSLESRFWREFIPMAFGPAAIAAVGTCAAFLVVTGLLAAAFWIRKRRVPSVVSAPLAVAFLTFVPCFLYGQVFQSHSSILLHFFSSLKFAAPLALLPLCIIPVALTSAISTWCRERTRQFLYRIAALTCLAAAIVYLAVLGDPHSAAIYTPLRPEYESIGRFIAGNTDYEDVVFSNSIEIGAIEPHYLVYAMKRIHPAHSFDDIARVLERTTGQCTINLFSATGDSEALSPELADLAGAAYATYHAGEMTLRKIHRTEFEQRYAARRPQD